MGRRTQLAVEQGMLAASRYVDSHRRGFSGAQMGRDLSMSQSQAIFHLHALEKEGRVVRVGRYRWKYAHPGTVEDSTARIVEAPKKPVMNTVTAVKCPHCGWLIEVG